MSPFKVLEFGFLIYMNSLWKKGLRKPPSASSNDTTVKGKPRFPARAAYSMAAWPGPQAPYP